MRFESIETRSKGNSSQLSVPIARFLKTGSVSASSERSGYSISTSSEISGLQTIQHNFGLRQRMSYKQELCRNIAYGLAFFFLFIILFCQSFNFIHVFKFYQIVFPNSLVFYVSNGNIGMVMVFRMFAKKHDFTQLARFMRSVNNTNLFFSLLSFSYHFAFEIFKIKSAPDFYYGGLGTSKLDI